MARGSTTQRDTSTPIAGPIAIPRVAPQRRWRPALVWLAVALIAAGGLIAWRVFQTVGTTHLYLAVNRPVAVSARMAAADLTTVRITADPALQPIPADRINTVVGKHAAVALVPGTLLTQAQLTDRPIPGPGRQLVGVSLAQDRMPAQRIKPGTQVLLVITSDQNGVQQPNQPAAAPPQTIQATVVDVTPGGKDGTVVVNVSVPDSDGPLVAARAAAGRIVIVLTAGG